MRNSTRKESRSGGQRVTFVLDAQDDVADPRTATQVAQKLVHDPAKIPAAMPVTDYEGVIGETTFDSKGDLKHGVISLYDHKNGKKTFLNQIKILLVVCLSEFPVMDYFYSA